MSHPMWFGLPIKPLMVTMNNKHELHNPAFAKAAECLHLPGTSDYSPRTIVTISLCQWSCQDTAVILCVPCSELQVPSGDGARVAGDLTSGSCVPQRGAGQAPYHSLALL